MFSRKIVTSGLAVVAILVALPAISTDRASQPLICVIDLPMPPDGRF